MHHFTHKIRLCVHGLECMCRPPTSPPKARLGICARDKQGEGGKAGSCVWVERRPWSGLAVLRPAGILSMACETAGNGGCTHRQLCEVPKCVWQWALANPQHTHLEAGQSWAMPFPCGQSPSVLWDSLVTTFHTSFFPYAAPSQPQQASRFLAHHTFQLKQDFAATCPTPQSLCPGHPPSLPSREDCPAAGLLLAAQ